jgi:outer membrane autotransporter protein
MTTDDGRSVWARGFVGEHVQQADGVSLHATNDYAGGAIGADLLARPDLRLGVFAGGGENKLAVDVNLETTNTNTAFGGFYGRYAFTSFNAPSFLDFALHGGASTNGNTRLINNNTVSGGSEIATANFNSSYVSPELKYGVDLPVWIDTTLTPSARLRYVAGFFGGYTESGSTADLTVNSRTTQDIEERGELKLTHVTSFTPADQLFTSIYGGVLGLERVGDTTINTVLLGQNLPFVTPGQNDVAGALGGLGVEWRTHAGVSFFGAGEYQALTDKSTNIGARGGVRVVF